MRTPASAIHQYDAIRRAAGDRSLPRMGELPIIIDGEWWEWSLMGAVGDDSAMDSL
jgi:hypothetical protein